MTEEQVNIKKKELSQRLVEIRHLKTQFSISLCEERYEYTITVKAEIEEKQRQLITFINSKPSRF